MNFTSSLTIANAPHTLLPNPWHTSLAGTYLFEPRTELLTVTANNSASKIAYLITQSFSSGPVITCSPEPAVWKSSQSITNNEAAIAGLPETRRLTGKKF